MGEQYLKTFCPQCGVNVAIDEDGCCAECGSYAVVSEAAFISLRSLQAVRIVSDYESRIKELQAGLREAVEIASASYVEYEGMQRLRCLAEG